MSSSNVSSRPSKRANTITTTSIRIWKTPQTVPWTGLEALGARVGEDHGEVKKLPLSTFPRPGADVSDEDARRAGGD